MKQKLGYSALTCIAIVLSWFLFNHEDIQTRDDSAFGSTTGNGPSEPTSYEGFSSGALQSNLTNRILPITSIPQLLALDVGDVFSLRGVSDKDSAEIEISVAKYDGQAKYTQMHGTTADDGIAIITVGVETVNVFIKERSGLYEFSGKGFDGAIPKIEKIVWGDDMYVDPRAAANQGEQELVQTAIEGERESRQ
jgi:hypothetical protein